MTEPDPDNLLPLSSPLIPSPITVVPLGPTLPAVEREDPLSLLPPSGRVKLDEEEDDLLPVPKLVDMGTGMDNPSSPDPIIIGSRESAVVERVDEGCERRVGRGLSGVGGMTVLVNYLKFRKQDREMRSMIGSHDGRIGTKHDPR